MQYFDLLPEPGSSQRAATAAATAAAGAPAGGMGVPSGMGAAHALRRDGVIRGAEDGAGRHGPAHHGPSPSLSGSKHSRASSAEQAAEVEAGTAKAQHTQHSQETMGCPAAWGVEGGVGACVGGTTHGSPHLPPQEWEGRAMLPPHSMGVASMDVDVDAAAHEPAAVPHAAAAATEPMGSPQPPSSGAGGGAGGLFGGGAAAAAVHMHVSSPTAPGTPASQPGPRPPPAAPAVAAEAAAEGAAAAAAPSEEGPMRSCPTRPLLHARSARGLSSAAAANVHSGGRTSPGGHGAAGLDGGHGHGLQAGSAPLAAAAASMPEHGGSALAPGSAGPATAAATAATEADLALTLEEIFRCAALTHGPCQ